jgi:hypothetical protein
MRPAVQGTSMLPSTPLRTRPDDDVSLPMIRYQIPNAAGHRLPGEEPVGELIQDLNAIVDNFSFP